jgi:MATE family multidrug resistance protein
VAIEALSEGVLSGAGDTHKVFWGTVPFNLLRVPLAWWMAFPLGMGALGVWWAINLSSFLKALVKGAMVLEGSWVRKGI